MNRLLILLSLISLLVCSCSDNRFVLEDEVAEYMEGFPNCSFAENAFDELLQSRSTSYCDLVKMIYGSSVYELSSRDEALLYVDVAYWEYKQAFSSVTNDVSGFIHDVKNMYNLGIAQDEINNYVYEYLITALPKCNKSGRQVMCELEQISQAPIQAISNAPIVAQITADIDKLVYEVEEFAKSYENTGVQTIPSVNFKPLEIGKEVLINYSINDTVVPVVLKVINVLTGEDAKDEVLSLSDNNRDIVSDNMCYIEYEVTNYSNTTIQFESRFFDADAEACEFFSDEQDYVGIQTVTNAEPYSTIMMQDVILAEHGGLVWYDYNADELYLLN